MTKGTDIMVLCAAAPKRWLSPPRSGEPNHSHKTQWPVATPVIAITVSSVARSDERQATENHSPSAAAKAANMILATTTRGTILMRMPPLVTPSAQIKTSKKIPMRMLNRLPNHFARKITLDAKGVDKSVSNVCFSRSMVTDVAALTAMARTIRHPTMTLAERHQRLRFLTAEFLRSYWVSMADTAMAPTSAAELVQASQGGRVLPSQCSSFHIMACAPMRGRRQSRKPPPIFLDVAVAWASVTRLKQRMAK